MGLKSKEFLYQLYWCFQELWWRFTDTFLADCIIFWSFITTFENLRGILRVEASCLGTGCFSRWLIVCCWAVRVWAICRIILGILFIFLVCSSQSDSLLGSWHFLSCLTKVSSIFLNSLLFFFVNRDGRLVDRRISHCSLRSGIWIRRSRWSQTYNGNNSRGGWSRGRSYWHTSGWCKSLRRGSRRRCCRSCICWSWVFCRICRVWWSVRLICAVCCYRCRL